MVTHRPYIGSGPYCYSNSLAMMFGDDSPSTALIEIATGSPFGMQLLAGELPFFDPYGWTPDRGVDAALEAVGWTSSVVSGGDEAAALTRLQAALTDGPVWVGPVEMGHLRYQPGMTGPISADHFLVVLESADDWVRVHDPQGYPYATIPQREFLTAWRAETISYGDPFTLRTDFRKVHGRTERDIVATAVRNGRWWLAMAGEHEMPPDSCGNAQAAEQLAGLIDAGCPDDLREHLVAFAVRVGARRLADAATVLGGGGFAEAARVMDDQARLVGSVQYALVSGDDGQAAERLRALARTYADLLDKLA